MQDKWQRKDFIPEVKNGESSVTDENGNIIFESVDYINILSDHPENSRLPVTKTNEFNIAINDQMPIPNNLILQYSEPRNNTHEPETDRYKMENKFTPDSSKYSTVFGVFNATNLDKNKKNKREPLLAALPPAIKLQAPGQHLLMPEMKLNNLHYTQ